MTASSREAGQDKAGSLQHTADLLGGMAGLHRQISNPLDAHELLDGLPAGAMRHLVDRLIVLGKTELFEKVIGMSLRTCQPRRDADAKPLSPAQNGRAWKFSAGTASSSSRASFPSIAGT